MLILLGSHLSATEEQCLPNNRQLEHWRECTPFCPALPEDEDSPGKGARISLWSILLILPGNANCHSLSVSFGLTSKLSGMRSTELNKSEPRQSGSLGFLGLGPVRDRMLEVRVHRGVTSPESPWLQNSDFQARSLSLGLTLRHPSLALAESTWQWEGGKGGARLLSSSACWLLPLGNPFSPVLKISCLWLLVCSAVC